MLYLLNQDKRVSLSPNFHSSEFECKCCGYAIVDSRLVQAVEQIRSIVGKPVTINSGYRCPKRNVQVGGGAYSRHLIGKAADIYWVGVEDAVHAGSSFRKVLVEKAPDLEIYGIGWARMFVHIDVDESRKHLVQWKY